MAQQRLQLVITADSRESDRALNRTGSEISSLDQIAARVANSISRHFQQMANEIQRAIQTLQGSLSGLHNQFAHTRQLVDQYGRPIHTTTTATVPPSASSGGYAAVAGAAGVAAARPYSVPTGFRTTHQYLSFLNSQKQEADEAIRANLAELRSKQAKYRAYAATGDNNYSINSMYESEIAYLRRSVRGFVEDARAYKSRIKEVTDQTEQLASASKNTGDGMAGSMVKAMVFYQALESGLNTIKTLTVESTKYAAETRMYGVAMHAVAEANGIAGESMDELEKKLKALGIGTQEARRGLISMAAAGMDLSKAPELARLGQDLAVMKPDMSSSQVFNNLIYGIQSGQTDVLRTIGLNVNFESGYKDLARSIKRTVESLSEEEKMRSRVNTVTKEASKYAGMYEKAQGEVGKQLKSMERFADDAKNAIGEQFIPAMKLVVATATWALGEISKNPVVARAVGVVGSAAAGAVIGAGIGGVVGSVVPGPGTAAGAILGAKIGATAGTVVGAGSMTLGEIESERQKADANYKWYAANRMTADQRRETIFSYVRSLGSRPQSTPPPASGDDKQAKAVASALEQAREALARSQAQALEGVAKINAEHDEIIRKLKQQGVLTSEIAGIYDQVRINNLQQLGKELDKQQDSLNKELTRAFQDARQRMDEPMQDQIQRLEDHSRRSVDAIQEVYRQADQYQLARLQRNTDVIRQQEELELTRLDQSNAHTLASQLGLEQQKLQVRLDFTEREKDAELKLLAFKAEIAKKEISIRYAGQEEMIAKLHQLIDLQAKLASDAVTEDAAAKGKLAREQVIKNQYSLVYEANKKLYDQLKQSAEGVFDAMLTKSQSVWSAMANAFKVAFLTVFKEIVSSQIARNLMSLLTGQRVQLAAGGAAQGGALGRLGMVLGGLGVGAVPVFAGGVGYPGAPGGTPGFVGPVQSISTGFFTGTSGRIFSTTVGGKTTWFDAATGMELTGNAARQAQFFGKFGKAGGAVQSGLFMAGTMLGMDGLRRGGLGGMLETTAGGAAIGTAIAPGIGTVIGAGIGAAVGGFRWLFGGKSPEQKLKERIKSITGVDVRQNSILKQWVQMSGTSTMMMDVWIRSRAGQDLIQLYADQTGQKFRSQYNVPQFSMIGSGGMVYESPAFLNGVSMNPISNLPGFGLSLDSIRGGLGTSAPIEITVHLDGAATKEFHQTHTLKVIAQNPRAVQAASLTAQRASAGRSDNAILALSPTALRS